MSAFPSDEQRQAIVRAAAAILVVIACATAVRSAAFAAELRLRPRCQPERALVLLGDVAEIHAADGETAAALAKIELGPAPVRGNLWQLSCREIQDVLALRGVNLASHRFSGASTVAITAADGPPSPSPREDRPVGNATIGRATDLVRRAILQCLEHEGAPADAWAVQPSLDTQQARLIAESSSELSIVPLADLAQGEKPFEVTLRGVGRSQSLRISARIAAAPACVVLAEGLTRGATIQAADVREVPLPELLRGQSGYFARAAEVIGLETAQTIAAGQPLRSDMLRRPLLVEKGRIVTVYSRSAGVRVRVEARARESGSLGDRVVVESLADRQTFVARVSGIREVEVHAASNRADFAE